MKLINETVYNSDDLRAFFTAGLHAFGGDTEKKDIRVAYSRRGGAVGGHASLGRAAMHSRGVTYDYSRRPHQASYMMIALPGPSYPVPSIHEVAHVLEHELSHNRGLNHGDMVARIMHWDGEPFPWAEGFQLRREEPADVELVYRCPHGHPEKISERHLRGWDLWCRVPVDKPSGWAPRRGSPPYENEDPPGKWLCGQRMKLTRRKKKLGIDDLELRVVARLDAARAARSAQAAKREARLRERLRVAEANLERLKRRVAMLKRKVSYYDRKVAKP